MYYVICNMQMSLYVHGQISLELTNKCIIKLLLIAVHIATTTRTTIILLMTFVVVIVIVIVALFCNDNLILIHFESIKFQHNGRRERR